MKKFNKGYIFYHLFIDFFIILFFLFVYMLDLFSDFIEQGDEVGNAIYVFIAIFVVIYAIKTIYSLLYVKMSGYHLKEKEIECKRGVLFRKRSILEYKKIHAVNKKQNIIQKMFKIAVLTLDSGSTNTSTTAEIIVFEREDVVDKLIKQIKLKQEDKDVEIQLNDENKERENLYKFTAKSKFAYSLLTTLSTLFVMLIITICGAILFSICIPLISKATNDILGVVLKIFLVSCIIYFGVMLFSFVISIIVSHLAYYDFKIYKSQSDLEISYGFFVKHNNTFKLNRIKGVVISQGIIKKLFGFVSVKLEVIGYNDGSENNNNDSSSMGILFPLCKKSEVKENLIKILPDYVPEEKKHFAKKYFPFISWVTLIVSLSILTPLFVSLVDYLYIKTYQQPLYTTYLANLNNAIPIIIGIVLGCLFIVLSLILISGYLQYKNNGIDISNDKLTIENGGFIKNTIVINKRNLIAIEDITTPLRKKKDIYSVKIHFKTNASTNVISLKNVDYAIVENLKNCVIY